MSLVITSDKIYIKNAVGTEQFNSNDKLLYKKSVDTGHVNALSGSSYITLNNYNYNAIKDIAIISIIPTSATGTTLYTGSAGAGLIGKTLQLNFGLITNVVYSTTTAAFVEYDTLTAMIIPGEMSYLPTSAHFVHRNCIQSANRVASISYIAFDYRITILSYL